MTIGKYDGYRLYLISCMDRYSVYSTYTLTIGVEIIGENNSIAYKVKETGFKFTLSS